MYLVFLLTFVFSCVTLFSQTRIRTESYIPDSAHYSVFHTKVPIQEFVPPIDSAMPNSVRLAYEILDSISRLYIRPKITEEWLESLYPHNDTLHTMWKYAYEMMDYDPIRLHQYLNDQDIQQKLYRNHSRWNFYRMIGKIINAHQYKKWQLYAALNSMYILRVSVLSIDSMKSKHITLGDSSQYNHFQITCVVTDTIKGKVIPMNLRNKNPNSKSSALNNTDNFPTFNFITTSNSSPQFIKASHFTPQFKKVDSLIFDFSRMIMRIKPRQDLIIFLYPPECIWTKTHDYIRLVVAYPYSSGVLPIVNGMVSDVNKIWSDSTWIPYETWREKYNETVDIIMNKRY